MKRSIDNYHILSLFNFLRSDRLSLYIFYKAVIYFLSDYIEKACLFSFPFSHSLNIRKVSNSVYFTDYSLILRRNHLCSIGPIYLIPVVFRRVVAGSNDYSGSTAQSSYGIGQFRSWAKLVKYIRFNSVGIQNKRRHFCKFRRHISRVICNGNPHFPAVRVIF